MELGLETLEDIHYDQLNFVPYDCKRFNLSVVKLLLSKNSTKLKRLAIKYCMVNTIGELKKENKEPNSLVSGLKTISEHCRDLKELELWGCKSCPDKLTDDLMGDIKYMTNLHKLTLDNFPRTCYGECFIKVSQFPLMIMFRN